MCLVSETVNWTGSRNSNNSLPLLTSGPFVGLDRFSLLMPFAHRQLANRPGPNKNTVSIRNSPFQRLEPITNRLVHSFTHSHASESVSEIGREVGRRPVF